MSDRGIIIVFGGQKGGVGKSTQATNFAVAVANEGADVIIIDTDPQKTSINWVDRRNELINNGRVLKIIHGISKEGNVRDAIKDLSSRYDVVVVDASGYDNKALRTSLTIADYVICPLRPSQADLETLPHLCEIIDVAKDINEKLKAYALISMSPTHPFNDETDSAGSILNEFANSLIVLKTNVAERKIYRDSMLEGTGVTEMKNEKAKIEIESIIKEILGE